MRNETTRRALVGGAGIAAVALIAPAIAAPITSTGSAAFRAAIDTADAAKRRYNALPADLESTDAGRHQVETDWMIATSQLADEAVPTTWSEFTRLIEHMTDDGHFAIDDDNATRLLAHARRLSGREA